MVTKSYGVDWSPMELFSRACVIASSAKPDRVPEVITLTPDGFPLVEVACYVDEVSMEVSEPRQDVDDSECCRPVYTGTSLSPSRKQSHPRRRKQTLLPGPQCSPRIVIPVMHWKCLRTQTLRTLSSCAGVHTCQYRCRLLLNSGSTIGWQMRALLVSTRNALLPLHLRDVLLYRSVWLMHVRLGAGHLRMILTRLTRSSSTWFWY
jgi:hypothetical protein